MTAVNIKFDDDLLAVLRVIARRRGQSLSLTVEQFLRAGIEADEESRVALADANDGWRR